MASVNFEVTIAGHEALRVMVGGNRVKRAVQEVQRGYWVLDVAVKVDGVIGFLVADNPGVDSCSAVVASVWGPSAVLDQPWAPTLDESHRHGDMGVEGGGTEVDGGTLD